jgi:hypothetical protein
MIGIKHLRFASARHCAAQDSLWYEPKALITSFVTETARRSTSSLDAI